MTDAPKLTGPGVLFGAALLAVLVYYTFPYNWSWVECLLFGAIFSATDPVAVVAVLKEVPNLHCRRKQKGYISVKACACRLLACCCACEVVGLASRFMLMMRRLLSSPQGTSVSGVLVLIVLRLSGSSKLLM